MRCLATVGVLLSIAALGLGTAWAAIQAPPAQGGQFPVPPGGLKRSVRSELTHHDPDQPRALTSEGALVIQFKLIDAGGSSRARRVAARVAVYERPDPRLPTPGRLVGVYAAPKDFVAPPMGDVRHQVGLEIPLDPGQYVFYLILCDPGRPVPEGLLERWTETYGGPVAEALPGPILHATICTAVVRPRP